MSVPTLVGVELAGSADLPLLVLGPSLGTSAESLWSPVAQQLGEEFHIVGWELPGHGHSHDVPQGGFTVADLAQGVLALVDSVGGGAFFYSGDSIGGATGLQLLLDAPHRVRSAALLCTGARIGEEPMWSERADLVRRAGTPALVESSAERWFSEGFVERQPTVAARLLETLQQVDRDGYAAACVALAAFDVRDRLAEIKRPVLAVAGAQDVAAPVEGMRLVAEGVQDGRLVVLDDVAHLAPAEAPGPVSRLLREHFAVGPDYAAGLAVRREVLGAEHVDRAVAGVTDLTREFQRFITTYAWGGIWTRPGLDRRSRSMITLTALVARGHHEELKLHLRAARRNGLSVEEIKEVLLQSAIYCGVPDANTAFRIAQEVLAEDDEATP